MPSSGCFSDKRRTKLATPLRVSNEMSSARLSSARPFKSALVFLLLPAAFRSLKLACSSSSVKTDEEEEEEEEDAEGEDAFAFGDAAFDFGDGMLLTLFHWATKPAHRDCTASFPYFFAILLTDFPIPDAPNVSTVTDKPARRSTSARMASSSPAFARALTLESNFFKSSADAVDVLGEDELLLLLLLPLGLEAVESNGIKYDEDKRIRC